MSETSVRIQLEEMENRKYIFSHAEPNSLEDFSENSIWFQTAGRTRYKYIPSTDTEVKSYKNYYAPDLSGVNLITYPYSENTDEESEEVIYDPVTINSINYTLDDYDIIADGLANGDSEFGIKKQNWQPYLFLEDGYYKYTCCPAGGDASTYYSFVSYGEEQGTTNPVYGIDVGEGFIFKSNPDERTGIWIVVLNDTNVETIRFSPNLQQIVGFNKVLYPSGNPQAQFWFERVME